jgi:hypothetical protein
MSCRIHSEVLAGSFQFVRATGNHSLLWNIPKNEAWTLNQDKSHPGLGMDREGSDADDEKVRWNDWSSNISRILQQLIILFPFAGSSCD